MKTYIHRKEMANLERLGNGNYLLSNGFQIIKEGNQWVAFNHDEKVMNKFLEEGFDQCFPTLSLAYEYMNDIERYI